MRFKTKKFFTTLVLAVCLVLFVSMYMMMNNIDETSDTEVEENDKVLLLKFKDNIMKLKEQLDANEAKINDLKEVLARAMSQNFSAAGNIKPNQAASRTAGGSELGTFPEFPKIDCPLSRVPVESQATIQMSDVFENLAFDNPDGGVWKQGYPISYNATQWNNKNKLHVFVIPHSHTDPGWIKTFEQYYTDQTSHILNNMVENLERNPRMRFVYAEMSFFSLWWSTISQGKKDRVIKLLKEKRLEIVTGGWVMTDEANSHYFAMLDQMIEGNQWLKMELGFQPKSAWAIDPFGHSPTMAYLLKKMSFKHMLIQRTHYSIKKELSKNKHLEFFWRQGWDATGETDMFCHMMPFYSYDIPHTCGPDPMICCQFDFRRGHGKYSCPWKVQPVPINEENVEERAHTLLDQYRKKSQLYKNNVLLIPLGDDFRYDTTEEWSLQHENYVKLFDYMNAKKEWNVEAKFGTLSDYFDMLEQKVGAKKFQDATNPEYQTLSGDFFVYADRDEHYWSGYFTSRPYYKKLDRELEYHQRTAEILFSLALAESRKVRSKFIERSNMGSSIVAARRSLGLFQHHDGITGTAKDHVVIDYGNKMMASINSLKQVITTSSALLLSKDKKSHHIFNRTIFDVDETREHHYDIPTQNVIDLSLGERLVYFYNSLAQSRTSLVTVHVTSASVEVKDDAGNVKVSQLDPVWEENGVSISTVTFKLSFIAEVPALGFSRYTIRSVEPGSNRFHHLSKVKVFNRNIDKDRMSVFEVPTETVSVDASIENEDYLLVISTSTGLSKRLVEKNGGKILKKMEINFVKYGTAHGREKSGAYLFLPDGEAKNVDGETPDLRITEGPLSSEAITRLPMVVHTIRLMSSRSGISGSSLDILNMVDIRDESNTELAMRISTDVSDVDGYFYTDLNGFQIIRRRYYSKIPLQGNIYPMSTVAYLENVKERFTLLTGQSLGVASLKPGELEVMQDRRLNQDDNRGVEQGVLDNKKTPNKFKILFEDKPYPSNVDGHVGFFTVKSHFVSLDMLHPLFRLVVSLFSDSINKQTLDLSFSAALLPTYTSLVEPLPCDLHLVNLRMMIDRGGEKSGTKLTVIPGLENALILHRMAFDCGFEAGAFGVNCGGVKTSLKESFSNTPIKEMKVMSLNLLEEIEVDSEEEIPPMELRAYRIKFDKSML